MLLRIPNLRSTSILPPRLLLLLLLLGRSSSCLAMADLSNSTTTSHQSPVENGKASSSAPSNDEHGASVAREPPRRRIAPQGLQSVRKHIRLNDREKPRPVRHDKDKDEISPDSIHKEGFLKEPKPALAKDSNHKKESYLLSASSDCSLVAKDITRTSSWADQLSEESSTNDDECLPMLKKYSLPTSFGKPDDMYNARKSNTVKNGFTHGARGGKKGSKGRNCYTAIEPFDICLSDREELLSTQSDDAEDHLCLSSFIGLEIEPEVDHVSEGSRQGVLRPGMVLLKNYITPSVQVSIVKKCRELGLGRGGFYQPGYKDGAKLRLHMMCLGLDWDPQSRKYQKRRQIDRSKPPDIPCEFYQLVDKAMQDSHALIRKSINSKAEEMLPPLSPDVCIVNFYTENGRLGLHQDPDESRESLAKGLPVVSFSIGDSAEFLYEDQRDVNKAEKLILESGDVLIFGGQSRHVFHGVACIIPNSAPKFLLQETRLRPGRLNLTFRQSRTHFSACKL